MTNITTLKQNILKLADHCVKCGLCSSQCPTYLLNRDENESPRGRIALAQALASDAIEAQGKLSQHLQSCLQCRRCEAACPSEVKYGELFKLTNELVKQKTGASISKTEKLISQLSHKDWTRLARLYQFARSTGLIHLARLSHLGKKLFNLAPQKTTKIKPDNIESSHKKDTIWFFTGCLSHLADQSAMNATITLLKLCGYEVKIPDNQTCCGAIAERQGALDVSQACQLSNETAFSDHNNDPIVFFTTGCGAKLKEYTPLVPNETYNAISFADRVFNVSDFLNKSEKFAKLPLLPLHKKILIFNPCSERNILKQTNVTDKFISRIPNIQIVNLSKSTGCCGASGTHLLTHEQQAQQVREPMLAQIIDLAPDIIVSPNYPCNLHIQAGLKEKNLDIPMIHPIELLLNQTKTAE